jgi:HK97 family phage major capsid protein
MLRFIDQLGRFGKFRKNALVLPMESASALMPKMESDLTVICPGEGKDMDKSDVGFSQIRLTPKTWCALAKVSTELSEDSVVALGEIIGMSIARSMARKEDLVGFVGDGTETYFGMKGIVGAFHSISSTISEIAGLVVGTGNAYSELVLSDFQLVVGLLPEQYDETAKWFMSKKFYYNVVWRIAQSAGVANIFEILSDKKSKYFLGYEVEFVHSMPSTAANSQICAVLGDLQAGAYLAERRSLLIEQSRDAYFGSNQLGIRGTERIDINCFGVGDKTNPGSIVGLITAAS